MLLRLSPRERRLRREMLACHKSQVATMVQLPERPWERLRPAPHYDFLQAPHEGPLQYEVLGFKLDGERWRQLAAEAIAAEREGEAQRSAS